MELKDRFKLARIDKKLSVTEAASEIGISIYVLLSYESGRARPQYDTLKEMIDLYGISNMYNFLFRRDYYGSRRLPVNNKSKNHATK